MQRFVLVPEEEYENLLKLKAKGGVTGRLNKPPIKDVKDFSGAGKSPNPVDPISVPPPGIPAVSVDDQHRADWASYWQKSS